MEVSAKFANFTALNGFGKFPRCPGDDKHLLSLKSIDRNNSLLVFISHCWLRGDATPPHPDNEEGDKYQLCIKGIEKVWKVYAPRMKYCFVWMDYCCMPQDKRDLSDDLSNYDKIVECCDVIFTPIVDPDHASWEVKEYTDIKDAIGAKSWRNGPRAYLNRAWCRVEMLYAAHIPVLDNVDSEVRRHTMFESALAYHCREGRRMHALFTTKKFVAGSTPDTVPPLQYRFIDDYHPLKGELSRSSDEWSIKQLLVKLDQYITVNTKELGYSGSVDVNGQKHGHGEYKFDDGEVYKGHWEKDKKHGHGFSRYPTGCTYEGEWENNIKHGHGVYRFADDSVYEGNWENNMQQDYGVYRYADGAVYEGNWENGKKHVHGLYRYADGDVYDGNWENDKMHGHGLYRSADGGVYEGNWENGKKHGHGLYRYADGGVCEGNWENGDMHGHGVYRSTDGAVYEGNWENGKKHGHGVYQFTNGAVYEGNWENGKKHGHGVYRYADGAKYEGNWMNDRSHGHGLYRSADGSVYDGNWENDTMHGHGLYRYADGAVCEGNWENGGMQGHGVHRYADGAMYDGNWENDKNHGHGVFRSAD